MPQYARDPITNKLEIIWYEPTFNFVPAYVLWLLDNLNTLKEHYPPEPSSSYTDSNIQKSGVSAAAPFRTGAEIHGELTARIDVCFPDCFLVYEHYDQGYDYERIASVHKLRSEDIDRRVNRVINYVSSGSVRRWINTEKRMGRSYQDWLHQGNNRSKVSANAVNRF